MRIAPATIVLELNGTTFTLRPSLGAAIRLAYAYELPALAKGVAEGNLSMLAAVIAETSGAPLSHVHAAVAPPFNGKLIKAINAAMAVLAEMLDFGEEDAKPATGTPMPLIKAFQHLFEIACGTIGWSPEIALNATPAQILIAYRGRVELLKALFGTSEDDKPHTPSFERDPDATAKLRELAGA